jgi:Dirigent-like protein
MECEEPTKKHSISWLLVSILVTFNLGTTIARPGSLAPDGKITFYFTGTVPVIAQHAKPEGLFKGQGKIDPYRSFLTLLTPLDVLEAGKLKFINQELQGEREIGTPLIGQVEGVQVTSVGDNTSSILALEVTFASTSGESKDSLRFFGVHHADVVESQIAVVGGTGKYQEASGFAIVKGDGGEEGSSNNFGFTVYLK